MRRSQITEFRVSKSYNQYNICWHRHPNEKGPFASLSPASNFDKGRKGNPKHTIMGRTYKPNQGQCLKCFYNLWQFFFFALFSIHELPAKNQWNGNGTILEIICNRFWKELGIELPLFRYGTLMLSHIRWFLFSKSKTSIDLKMAKQPVKHVESHNRAGERDYKISKPFHSRDQGERPRHYRR